MLAKCVGANMELCCRLDPRHDRAPELLLTVQIVQLYRLPWGLLSHWCAPIRAREPNIGRWMISWTVRNGRGEHERGSERQRERDGQNRHEAAPGQQMPATGLDHPCGSFCVSLLPAMSTARCLLDANFIHRIRAANYTLALVASFALYMLVEKPFANLFAQLLLPKRTTLKAAPAAVGGGNIQGS